GVTRHWRRPGFGSRTHRLQGAADNLTGGLHGIQLTWGARWNEVLAAASSHLLADGFHRGIVDLVDGAFGLDVDDLIAVVVDQRHGLVTVDRHPGADGFLVVIGAATSQHALDDDVIGDLEVEHAIQALVVLGQQVVEDLGLFYRARESVEQEAVGGIVLRQAIFDHARGDVGWHELSGVHVAFSFYSQRGAFANVRAEEVSGGDVGNVQLFAEDCCLSTFASTGRAEENESHYLRSPS